MKRNSTPSSSSDSPTWLHHPSARTYSNSPTRIKHPKRGIWREKSQNITSLNNASSQHRRGHNSQLLSVNVSFVLLLMCSQFCDLPLVLPYFISTIQYAATPVTVVFCLMRTTALTLKSRAATWVEVFAKPAMQSQWAAMTSPVLVMMTHGRRGVSFIRWEGSTCTHKQTTVSHVLLCKHWNNVHI